VSEEKKRTMEFLQAMKGDAHAQATIMARELDALAKDLANDALVTGELGGVVKANVARLWAVWKEQLDDSLSMWVKHLIVFSHHVSADPNVDREPWRAIFDEGPDPKKRFQLFCRAITSWPRRVRLGPKSYEPGASSWPHILAFLREVGCELSSNDEKAAAKVREVIAGPAPKKRSRRRVR
jgi:hypothetical protein